MNADHRDMESLILGFEHLDEADTERALAHLAGCESCRLLRQGLLEREASARPAGALPEHARLLRDADRDAADASLSALLDRALPARAAEPVAAVAPEPRTLPEPVVAEEPPPAPRIVPMPAPRRRAWGVATWLVPAAAAAALAVTFLLRPPAPKVSPTPTAPVPAPAPTPAPTDPASLLPASGLSLERDPGLRGPADSTGWRTGDAFVLRFWLRQSAHVAVWHVGPDGAAERIYPAPPADRAAPHAAGEIELPGVNDDQRWTFEGEPGTETFLVVTAPPGSASLAAVASQAEADLLKLTDRIGRIAVLTSVLEDRLGPVARIEVEHVP